MSSIKDENYIPDIIAELEKLETHHVDVGWFGDIAKIAATQEYGALIPISDGMRRLFAAMGYPLRKDSTHFKVPDRAPLRKTAEKQSAQDALSDIVEAGLWRLLTGEIDADTLFAMMGDIMVAEVIETVTDGIEPPNHPVTVMLKGSAKPPVTVMLKGSAKPPVTVMLKGSAKPLINTGDLLARLGWEVVSA